MHLHLCGYGVKISTCDTAQKKKKKTKTLQSDKPKLKLGGGFW